MCHIIGTKERAWALLLELVWDGTRRGDCCTAFVRENGHRRPHQLRHNCPRHHHGYLYRYRIVVRRAMPMYMLSSLSFSPCYRYRYRTAALRAMPMLRHTGHAHLHVVVIVIALAIYMSSPSLSHCRITGHAHVDTYGPRPCTCRCQFLFLLPDGVLNLSNYTGLPSLSPERYRPRIVICNHL